MACPVNGSARRAHPILVVCSCTVLLTAAPQAAKAGLLQPLLQLLRPRLETELTKSCTALIRDASGGVEALSSLAEGPCRAAAKPMSACLIREAGRSGKEWQVISEVVRGDIGEHSQQVVLRCISQELGLPANGLGELLHQGLLKERRR